MSRSDDFEKPKKGKRVHIFRAIIGVILAAIFYVGIPYEMLYNVIPNQLIEKAVAGLTIDWTNLKPLFERWMYAGIAMVIVAFPVWLFPKGSRGRLAFSILYLVASICWWVYVLNFGNLSDLVTITYNGSIYGFGIVLQVLLYVIIFFKCLKILTIYAVYKDNRSDYLDSFPEIVKQV